MIRFDRFEELPAQEMVGVCLPMSWVADRTPELWRRFMPLRTELSLHDGWLYSLQDYPNGILAHQPTDAFTKWALVSAAKEDLPQGIETYHLAGSRYAVFQYQGPASGFGEVFQFIFGEWLPSSSHQLAQRPHFERFTESYNPVSPTAEEEIWIPVM